MNTNGVYPVALGMPLRSGKVSAPLSMRPCAMDDPVRSVLLLPPAMHMFALTSSGNPDSLMDMESPISEVNSLMVRCRKHHPSPTAQPMFSAWMSPERYSGVISSGGARDHGPAYAPDGVHGAQGEGHSVQAVVYARFFYAEGGAVPDPCPDCGAEGVGPGESRVLYCHPGAEPACGDAAAGDGKCREVYLQYRCGGVFRGGGVYGELSVEHGAGAGQEVLQGYGAAAEVVSGGLYHGVLLAVGEEYSC